MKIISKISNFDFSQIAALSIEEGVAILIDKDVGWTSFDVVAKIRKLTKIKKVGHAGTLDPLAEGLLILCLGRATKRIEEFVAAQKQYESVFRIGATTKSNDSEFPEEHLKDYTKITSHDIKIALSKFEGDLLQIPPQFSAKKIDGKRAYKLARQDKTIDLKPSQVSIYSISLISAEFPYINVLIDCSKGTYIRALARDLGEQIGIGAYMKSLRRTKIGNFDVNSAFKIQELIELFDSHNYSIQST